MSEFEYSDDEGVLEYYNYKIEVNDGMCERCGNVNTYNDGEIYCMVCGHISAIDVESYVANMVKIDNVIGLEQRKFLHKKMQILNKNALSRGLYQVPAFIINDTIELFLKLKDYTKETRNQKMRSRLGACLYISCINFGMMRSKREIKQFCMLNKSITSALDMIKIQEYKGDIKGLLYTAPDLRQTYAHNICLRCENIPSDVIDIITREVSRILNICDTYILISSSMFDTKVSAVTYIAIRLANISITIDVISTICTISSETLMKLINVIKEYRSLFDFKIIL